MKKPVSIILILLGLTLVAFGALLSRRGLDELSPSPEKPAVERSPVTNDHRIVKLSNGKFSIEYYWTDPGWHGLGRSEYENLELARRVLDYIETPEAKPVVVWSSETTRSK